MLVSPQSLAALAIGGLVGLVWWYTEFLLQPYWNLPCCGAFVVLTCLSARVEYGKQIIPWIDRVAWNSNGTLLVPNDHGEWVPMEEDDSSVSTEGSDDEAQDEARAGSRIHDDDDVESPIVNNGRGNSVTELVPSDRATQMRSRRTTTLQ
jgi:hypothetical protein